MLLHPFPIHAFLLDHRDESTDIGDAVAQFERSLFGGSSGEEAGDDGGGLREGAGVASTVPCERCQSQRRRGEV